MPPDVAHLTVVAEPDLLLSIEPEPVVNLTVEPTPAVTLTVTPTPAVAVTVTPTPVVSLVVEGMGAQGPAGITDSHVHHQTTAASQWFISHGRTAPVEPLILLDDQPTRPVWTDYDVPTPGLTVLTFPAPVTGYAYA